MTHTYRNKQDLLLAIPAIPAHGLLLHTGCRRQVTYLAGNERALIGLVQARIVCDAALSFQITNELNPDREEAEHENVRPLPGHFAV